MQGKYKELHRLLQPRRLAANPNWDPAAEFAVRQPLFLEIGFGNGEYLARQAEARPHHNFLGLELHWGSVRRTLRRLAQGGADNVRVMQVDAHVAVRRLLPDSAFHGFVALFPCPWPKRSHERWRLFSTEFMAHLNRVCRADAPGLVVTDHEGLRDYALAQAPGSGLEVRLDTVPAAYNTKYERRWSGQGQALFYELHYKRAAEPQVTRLPEGTLNTLTLPHFDPDRLQLEPLTGDLTVDFRQQLFDRDRQIWMVLTVVVEDHLTQTFWIECQRAQAGWLLRPARGGGFYPTLGVDAALQQIRHAAQRLGETDVSHPEAQQAEP